MPADPGAAGIADIEGALVQRGGKVRRLGRRLDDANLQRRHDDEDEQAPQENHRHRNSGDGAEAGKAGQQQRQHQERADHRRHQLPVGQPAADDVADGHAAAEQKQHPGDSTRRKAGDVGEIRLDVGEDGKQAGGSQCRDQHGQPHLQLAQHAHLAKQAAAARFGDIRWHQPGDGRDRDEADAHDSQEGGAPAEGLAKCGAAGNAEDVGQCQPGEHQRDGARPLVARHQAGCNDRADAEEGAVAEGGEDARGRQHPIIGRDGAEEIADDEQGRQPDQHWLARQMRGGQRDHRRAEDDAQCIAGDQKASRRDRNAEIGGDLRQQAHDDEFGGADAEGRNGKRKDRQGHGASRLNRFKSRLSGQTCHAQASSLQCSNAESR